MAASGQMVGGFNGTSVVLTHMTNPRLTDPEIFEFPFPLRLENDQSHGEKRPLALVKYG